MKTWKAQLETSTKEFIKNFGELTAEELHWKPNPSTWSIAENMVHLIQFNSSYFSQIEALQKGNYKIPFTGKFGGIVSYSGKTILKSVQPDRKKKIKTLSLWEPTHSKTSDALLELFEAHQIELQQVMDTCEHLLEKGAVISSPANKYIVYTLETAFEIIVAHEKRHLEQAKEILQSIH